MKKKKSIGGRTSKCKSNCSKEMNQIIKLKAENKKLKKSVDFLSDGKVINNIKIALKQIKSGKCRVLKRPFKG